jgi:cystathionine beta-lyase/cystathionine gamma-synthase
MLSFYLKSDNFDCLCDFAKNLRLFKFGTSLGGVDSLIDHYGGTMRIFYPDKKQQEKRGYTDNFFRMSVGIEEPEDLIEDLR